MIHNQSNVALNCEQPMIPVGAIGRYSTDRQQSCDAQINNILREIKRRGLPFKIVPEAIIKIEAVRGDQLIGTPEMERAVELAKQGVVEFFLVEDVTRFARSEAVDTHYRGRLLDYGVRVLALDDGFIDPEGEGHLLTGVKKLMSQEEIRKIGFRIKRTMRDTFSKTCLINGKEYLYVVGVPPYGYKTMRVPNCPKHLNTSVVITDEKPAKIVKEIFELYALKCISPEIIARILNQRGVPTMPLQRFSGLWSGRTIRKMLRNEKYVGLWILGKYEHAKNRITGRKKRIPLSKDRWLVQRLEYLRIIPQDLWEKAQGRMDERSQSFRDYMTKHGVLVNINSLRHKEKRYLFSGLCVCGQCGGNMIVQPGGRERQTRKGRKPGQLWVVRNTSRLVCHNKKRGACSIKANFRLDRLEKEFLTILKEKLLEPQNLERLFKEVETKLVTHKKKAYGSIDKVNDEIVGLHKELEGYRKAIAKLQTSDFLLESLRKAEERLNTLIETKMKYERDMETLNIQVDHRRIIEQLGNLEQILAERPQQANEALASILHEKVILEAEKGTSDTIWSSVKKWAIVRLKRGALISDREPIQNLDLKYIEFKLDISMKRS